MKDTLRSGMRHERKLILLLCAIAALRVFIFSAAFPFFNNVDEQAHLDLVMKYARGELPHDLGHYSSESANYISLYGTPEYFTPPQQFKTNDFPAPNWTLPAEHRENVVNRTSAWWQGNENHESGEPPLYYTLAALWLNLGRVFQITNGWLLYWLRFLNVLLAVALVWVGFAAARLIFPDQEVMATCLAKTTNIALLFVVPIALIFKFRNLSERRTLRPLLLSVAALIGSVAVPIALWFAWNVHTFGDLTATASKLDFLGWTRKPLSNWWPHPIFTLHGLKEFWPDLMASFWRGEFVWHGTRLACQATDAFYWISSTVAILLTPISLIWRRSKLIPFQRQSLWLALSSFVVLVLLLAVLSIAFDFGLCVYPSREHPYFTSGRLISAAAVPFFLLYSYALQRVLSWIPMQWPRIILSGGIVLFIVISQSVVNSRAFRSHYNLFHLSQSL